MMVLKRVPRSQVLRSPSRLHSVEAVLAHSRQWFGVSSLQGTSCCSASSSRPSWASAQALDSRRGTVQLAGSYSPAAATSASRCSISASASAARPLASRILICISGKLSNTSLPRAWIAAACTCR
ncbi:hypothetical protein D3C73_1064750 [compost metagenome]